MEIKNRLMQVVHILFLYTVVVRADNNDTHADLPSSSYQRLSSQDQGLSALHLLCIGSIFAFVRYSRYTGNEQSTRVLQYTCMYIVYMYVYMSPLNFLGFLDLK